MSNVNIFFLDVKIEEWKSMSEKLSEANAVKCAAQVW